MANVNLANSKTTIFGALAGLCLALSAIPVPILVPYVAVFVALAGIFGALANYYAKDATTGSTPVSMKKKEGGE